VVHFKKTELKNGIRVVTEMHPQSRSVSIGIWVLTGTRDEPKEQMGISHFLEHLVFKGTKTRTAYQIAKSLEALGGELNAYTTKEYTCYHALVLKEHWLQALDVLSDLVCNMQLNKKEFNLEKGVILQEIAMGEDAEEEWLYDIFFEEVYGKHPLSWPILGTVKTITEMKQNQIMKYYKETYAGQNIIVSAAGPIDHQDLVDEVNKKLKGKKKTRFQQDRKAPRWNACRKVVDKNCEQTHVLLGFPTASFEDKFRFEAFILNTLLGGGMTSKLYQSVRERKGLVYSIYSSLNTFMDTGQISIYAGCDQENVEELIDIVKRELQKVKKSGITKSDVELYKTQVIGSILLGADDVENRMTSLGVNEMVFEKYRSMESVVEEIEQVTYKSVNQFIDERFNLDQIAGVLLGPGVKSLASWWDEYDFAATARKR
jgi:predicted Zn-dependent peptidase